MTDERILQALGDIYANKDRPFLLSWNNERSDEVIVVSTDPHNPKLEIVRIDLSQPKRNPTTS